jgi:signal transduction histidine kinase
VTASTRTRVAWVALGTVTLLTATTGWVYPLYLPMLASLAAVALVGSRPSSGLALALAVAAPLPWVPTVDRAVLLALVSSVAWGASVVVAGHRAQVAREARAELEAATYRAVTEERLRIARDLHDLVAHGMSVITVQAGYGALVGREHHDVALEALEAIDSTGRETLAQVRHLLEVLREPGAPLRPTPGLADLEMLVATTERAGLEVTTLLEVSPDAVPGDLGACVYRIVQEGLSNVLRHSDARHVRLTVVPEGSYLRVAVEDDGRPGPAGSGDPTRPGHGLLGIRERLAGYHGTATAGPGPDGGFLLDVRIPRLPSAAAPVP